MKEERGGEREMVMIITLPDDMTTITTRILIIPP